MGLTKWFVKKGYVYVLKNQPNGLSSNEDNGFDLLKWLRQSLLSYLNVPYWDNCCDSAKTTFPVRYNATSQKLEAFNGTTWVKPPSTALT